MQSPPFLQFAGVATLCAAVNWIEDAGRCARVIGVSAPPVLQSERFATPCVVGWQRPVILLPGTKLPAGWLGLFMGAYNIVRWWMQRSLG